MDSLPEQPIDDALTKPQQKEVYEKLARLCIARSRGGSSEEELAKWSGFANADVMRISLSNWGLLNLLPRQEKPKKANKARRERKGRFSGPIEDLPPAIAAAPLFREKLDLLVQASEDLKYRKEKRQAGRFLLSRVDTSPQTIRREDYPEDLWEGLASTYILTLAPMLCPSRTDAHSRSAALRTYLKTLYLRLLRFTCSWKAK